MTWNEDHAKETLENHQARDMMMRDIKKKERV
jgi:hypothetical protein